MNIKYLTAIVPVLVAGCQPMQDHRFLTVGPGVALHDSRPASTDETAQERLTRDTADTEMYLSELCRQLGESEECFENQHLYD